MKSLFLIALTLVLTHSAFAKCPDDLAGSYKSSSGDPLSIAVDAKTKVVTISIDGQAFSAPANGVKTAVPAFGPTLSVVLYCDGEKLEQQSYDSAQPQLELTGEYFLDKDNNLISNDPRTPRSAQTLVRQP